MTRLFILPAIFVAATFFLWLLICNAPEWDDQNAFQQLEPMRDVLHRNGTEEEVSAREGHLLNTIRHDHSLAAQRPSIPIQFPSQFDNFTALAYQFRCYKQRHSAYITTLFICTYLYKQTFAIPGSFLLNIIAGAIFGFWSGFLLCCVLTTAGSTLCYLFSEFFSREYVLYYFGEKITYLKRKVDDNSHRLLAFLLFARMFPISPSWLLNIVAPFLNIPLPMFAFSVFVGLAPYNFICVQAGFILSDLESWDDVFSTVTMLKLSSFALLPLCCAMFSKQRRQQHSHNVPTIRVKHFYPSQLFPLSYTTKTPHQHTEIIP